jgi:hypothetical protein
MDSKVSAHPGYVLTMVLLTSQSTGGKIPLTNERVQDLYTRIPKIDSSVGKNNLQGRIRTRKNRTDHETNPIHQPDKNLATEIKRSPKTKQKTMEYLGDYEVEMKNRETRAACRGESISPAVTSENTITKRSKGEEIKARQTEKHEINLARTRNQRAREAIKRADREIKYELRVLDDTSCEHKNSKRKPSKKQELFDIDHLYFSDNHFGTSSTTSNFSRVQNYPINYECVSEFSQLFDDSKEVEQMIWAALDGIFGDDIQFTANVLFKLSPRTHLMALDDGQIKLINPDHVHFYKSNESDMFSSYIDSELESFSEEEDYEAETDLISHLDGDAYTDASSFSSSSSDEFPRQDYRNHITQVYENFIALIYAQYARLDTSLKIFGKHPHELHAALWRQFRLRSQLENRPTSEMKFPETAPRLFNFETRSSSDSILTLSDEFEADEFKDEHVNIREDEAEYSSEDSDDDYLFDNAVFSEELYFHKHCN